MMRLIVEIQSNCIFSAFYSKLINTPSLTSDLPNIHRQLVNQIVFVLAWCFTGCKWLLGRFEVMDVIAWVFTV